MTFPSDALLHVCCAPCLASAMATLRHDAGEGAGPARIFFYNPNIHPLLEFRRRVKALRVYLERDPVPAEIDDGYGLGVFLALFAEDGVPRDRRDRCRMCYRLRLRSAAAEAAAKGLPAFSTTLLASREQDRGLVAEVGREAAAEQGLEFVEADLRLCPADDKMLRGIYKQQYCGCIFSEEERFRGTNKHVYFAPGNRFPDVHST